MTWNEFKKAVEEQIEEWQHDSEIAYIDVNIPAMRVGEKIEVSTDSDDRLVIE